MLFRRHIAVRETQNQEGLSLTTVFVNINGSQNKNENKCHLKIVGAVIYFCHITPQLEGLR